MRNKNPYNLKTNKLNRNSLNANNLNAKNLKRNKISSISQLKDIKYFLETVNADIEFINSSFRMGLYDGNFPNLIIILRAVRFPEYQLVIVSSQFLKEDY